MLKERAEVLRKTLVVLDLFLVSGAYFLGYFLAARLEEMGPLGSYIRFLPVFAAIWGILLYFLGTYQSFRTKGMGETLYTVFEVVLIGIGGSGIFLYFLNIQLPMLNWSGVPQFGADLTPISK